MNLLSSLQKTFSKLPNLSALLSANSQTSHPNPLLLAPQFLAAVIPLASSIAIAQRTLLTGTASYLDTLVLCPGILTQQNADVLGGGDGAGEYPATAAMTTGYVFRTENQAMVGFMQRVGITGSLITVEVKEEKYDASSPAGWRHKLSSKGIVFSYLLCLILTILAGSACAGMEDWYALYVLALLSFARALNVVVLKRRAMPGWHGLKEPGVKGDLLVLLSQDRWVRLQGLVDDLKAVTSGSWLQPATMIESVFVSFATVIVYLSGILALGTTLLGSGVIVLLLIGSMMLLGWANLKGSDMRMHGRIIKVVGLPKKYKQRTELAKELIKEHDGRDNWAITLGMIVPSHERLEKATM